MTKPRFPSDEEGDEETQIFDSNQLAVTTSPDNPPFAPENERASMPTVIAPAPINTPPPMTPVPAASNRAPMPNLGSDPGRLRPGNAGSAPRASGLSSTPRTGDSKSALNTVPRPSANTIPRTRSGSEPASFPRDSSPRVASTPQRNRAVDFADSEHERTLPEARARPSAPRLARESADLVDASESTAPDAEGPFARGAPSRSSAPRLDAPRNEPPTLRGDVFPGFRGEPPATRIDDAAPSYTRGEPIATPSRSRAAPDARESSRNRAVPETARGHGDARDARSDVARTRPAPDTSRGRPDAARTRPATGASEPVRSKPATGAPEPRGKPATGASEPRGKPATGAPEVRGGPLPSVLRGKPPTNAPLANAPSRPTPASDLATRIAPAPVEPQGSRQLAQVQRVERMPVRLDASPQPPSRATAALEATELAPPELPETTNPNLQTMLESPDPTNPGITMPRMEAFDGGMTPKPTVVRELPRLDTPDVTSPMARRYQPTPGPEMTLTNAVRRNAPPFVTPPPHLEMTGPDSGSFGMTPGPDIEMTDPDPPMVAPDPTRIGIVDQMMAPRTLPAPVMPPSGPLSGPHEAPNERVVPQRLQRYTPTSMQAAAPEASRKVGDHLRMYTPTSILVPDEMPDPNKLRAATEHSGDKLPNPVSAIALDAPVFDPPRDSAAEIKMISMKTDEANAKREAKQVKPQLRSIHDVQSGPLGPPPAGFGFLAPPREVARPTAPKRKRAILWMVLATLAIAIAVATTMYLVAG